MLHDEYGVSSSCFWVVTFTTCHTAATYNSVYTFHDMSHSCKIQFCVHISWHVTQLQHTILCTHFLISNCTFLNVWEWTLINGISWSWGQSSRRIHNVALYYSARPDLCIRNHNWNQYGASYVQTYKARVLQLSWKP